MRMVQRVCLPVLALVASAVCAGCRAGPASSGPSAGSGSPQSWQRVLAERLPLYGHRNWIVIADSAYPDQARDGIETVATHADQVEVVRTVLNALDHTRHVTPTVYTDAELKAVPEADAPGVSAYRRALAGVLGDRPVSVLPHEQIISKLDEAGKTYRILILKTNLTIPYTSVFLRLDCGYWNADKENRLRESTGPSTR